MSVYILTQRAYIGNEKCFILQIHWAETRDVISDTILIFGDVFFRHSIRNTCKCITVKIVGGISFCNGGKLEESEGSNCFFSFLCVRINRSALVRELLSNKSLFVGQL